VCVYVLTGQRVWRPHSSCVRVCVYVCSCVLREREYVWMYVSVYVCMRVHVLLFWGYIGLF